MFFTFAPRVLLKRQPPLVHQCMIVLEGICRTLYQSQKRNLKSYKPMKDVNFTYFVKKNHSMLYGRHNAGK